MTDDAAPRQNLRELMQRLRETRLAAGFEQRQIAEDRAHVAGAISCGHVRMNLLIERHQPDRVLLPVQQIRQRRRQKLRVLQLRHRARVGVIHRRARIDQQGDTAYSCPPDIFL
jgi:hypothetical protein